MNEQLKPCPFCGGNEIVVEWPICADGFIVYCRECGCEYHTYYSNEDDAIAAWSRREEIKANARLIAAAPEMYELLNSMCSYINELENIMPHFPDALSLLAKNGIELLARIDETEASNG